MEKSVLHFIGLGIGKGQNYKGLDLSPAFARAHLRNFQTTGQRVLDHGDVSLSTPRDFPKVFSNEGFQNFGWAPYQAAYQHIRSLLNQPGRVLNWGGDHSVGISTVGAFCSHFSDGYVIWIDAHADLNLPTSSETGSVHGMPVSVLLNLDNIGSKTLPWLKTFLRPERLIYLGLRDLDPFEKETIHRLGIKSFSYSDIKKRGVGKIAEEILNSTQGHPLHVSFDIDSMDPVFSPSTGVPVKGGFSPGDFDELGRALFQRSDVRSIDVVEINPLIGTQSEVLETYSHAFKFIRAVLKADIDPTYALEIL
jgi:arginase